MSFRIPAQRATQSVIPLTASRTPTFIVPISHRRTLFSFSKWKKNESPSPKPVDLLTESYLKQKPKQAPIVRGSLAPSSIFQDETIAGTPERRDPSNEPRNPMTMAPALDPKPDDRLLWNRKMVIREIRARGRVSKTIQLKRTERQLQLRSHDFLTSVKKLTPLARQIAGKTVDEAIIQMRFSKKKAAKEVRLHLEHAKNEAIVKRGMGLASKEGGKAAPVMITTNDGRKVKVTDPTTMYVDQAWCGRGYHTFSVDYRARGNAHMMKNPSASLSVILKEEKTRIRQHNEREHKAKTKKVWVQLPNRPITAQRQYYSW